MRAEVHAIVDKLVEAQALPWLRIIGAARLDDPPEVDDAADIAVMPYLWLLHHVGEGVKLTQAGYLPPAMVKQAMIQLGWQHTWYGSFTRESDTRPILELRESALRFGLLRKNRGELLVTKLGRTLQADPTALWWHLADRLPEGTEDAERDAGTLYLLMIASGEYVDRRLLADGLSIIGWRLESYGPLDGWDAFWAARPTSSILDRLGIGGSAFTEGKEPPTRHARLLARAALLGRDAPSVRGRPERPQRKREDRADQRAVQLHVQLRDVEPPVWRRIVVPSSLNLAQLHAVLQAVMGWKDYHLHQFEIAGVSYGADLDEAEDLEDERERTLGDVVREVEEFEYEYDFGDGWTHDIRVEQVMPSVGLGTPHVVDGARACPPKDCGGPGGYRQLLEVLADPTHEEHTARRVSLGWSFDPEAFDRRLANAKLQLLDRHVRRR